jgi:hypothetical protein
VSYLRLTLPEYRAITDVSVSLDLRSQHPPEFRRYLMESLEGASPGLAERVSRFTDEQVRALLRHLWQRRQVESPLPLNTWEVSVLAKTCSQLIGHDRFLGPVKVGLVRALLPVCPDLAARLAGLSDRQFGRLWAEVRRRAGRDS